MPERQHDEEADGRPDRRPAGELEAGVLAALWAAGAPLTPAAVQLELGTGLARTTVTTILTRLHAKGVVTRARSGRGYAYAPAQDAPGLTARRMHAELDKDDDRSTVLARFVSDLSPEDEDLLRDLLEGGQDASRPLPSPQPPEGPA
ncbi:BlaI/MecI/CopY family transcriptional regulator [Streptomyces sp. NPDC005840]|uniref:BlaI/MecI/CopY family transcriptional regulator n=1 Tax=Streptomyces doudnae TaxID=3075536 RepID=A0ABD5EPA3_9ACTN|nr:MULTISPECIES: BlaI/MecI/CopY family transcriptional regulator [unclassified Streptomyces]MDT0436140.1 BlaI/MecI/CopY family transcriptional regulator [Streptomyces sp. DSM 41981]MYQ68003.1 BlaI/MecI/CopY family transcriptional regulator [Streptomyces sp. SID4950]SCE42104.1 Predicted transcriptional regulator [Streptomyces sp. SolWspMP-5a-2]